MKICSKRTNLLEQGQIAEAVTVTILVPDTAMEVDFCLSWVRYDLRDDLGDDVSSEMLGRFHRACDRIHYSDHGKFVFNSLAKMADHGKDISFFVQRYRNTEDEREPSSRNEFQLLWEQGGVCQSLYEASIIDDLMKQIL